MSCLSERSWTFGAPAHLCEQRAPRGMRAILAVAVGAAMGATALAQVDQTRLTMSVGGHPTADMLPAGPVPVDDGLHPPLVSGEYVNFESPPFRPIAFDPAAGLLAVVNTPAGNVHIFNATDDGGLTLRSEIPVGLEPVSAVFQPGALPARLWVINHISDNAMILNAETGAMLGVVPLRDEPISLVFNATGSHAFVVSQSGWLQAINTGTRALVGEVSLPANTPRAAVFLPNTNQVVVAALHSGNNTTVAARVMRHVLIDLNTGEPVSSFSPILINAWFFEGTSAIFGGSSLLSPWPDAATGTALPGPLVARIVPDAGQPSDWNDVVAVFDDGAGNPDPAVVSAYQAHLNETGLNLNNINEVIDTLINDVRDTVDHDLLTIDVSNPASMSLVATLGGVGTTLTALARNPANGALCVANLQALNVTRLEPNLRGHFIDHQIVFVPDPQSAAGLNPVDLHASVPNFNDAAAPNPEAQSASLANPIDIQYRGDGSRAYVLSLGADRVGVVDGATGAILSRVDVGRGPRGMALNEAAQRLYVFNRTDMTISSIDLSQPQPAVVATTSLFTPESLFVRAGRDFLYSTRHSNNFSSSCAMCHIDGHLDHNAWDLGQPGESLQPIPHITGLGDPCLPDTNPVNHPLKGPMVTLSLRGLNDHAPFHWRGDRPEFVDFNPAFDGLLGGAQIPDLEMTKFDAFVKSIAYAPNPNRNRNDSFINPLAAEGREHFKQSCNGCHQLTHDGARQIECATDVGDVGFNLDGLSAQVQLVPQLRHLHRKFDSDLYNGVGLLHDGREKREDNGHVIQTFLLEFFGGFTPQDREEMIAFLEAYPTNAKPVVGWQTVLQTPAGPGQVLPVDLQTMFDQHLDTPSACDVVARRYGPTGVTGYVLVNANITPSAWEADDGSQLRFGQLAGTASSTTPIVFMAVPPGSGRRLGVDQDTDGFNNRADSCPQVANNGDLNGDGFLTVSDIAPFVQILVDPAGYAAQFPALNGQCIGDMNNSGAVSVGDIGPFVSALIGG